MKPESIVRGHSYRFRGGLSIYLITHIWKNADVKRTPEAQVAILQHGHIAAAELQVLPLAELAESLSGEVRPDWIDMLDGAMGCKYDAGGPPKVPGQCVLRGYHSFRSQAPESKCGDCGITVLQAVQAAEAKLEAEAMAAEDPVKCGSCMGTYPPAVLDSGLCPECLAKPVISAPDAADPLGLFSGGK